MQELLALGCSRHEVRRAVERGELRRAHPNVFCVAGAPPSWEQRLLIATLAGGSGTLASHRSAARLWRLDGSTAGIPEVVTPRHQRSWAPHLGRIHESTDLHLAGPTERWGIPCTGVVRTLVDLGAVVPFERVHQAVDDAVRRGLCSWDDALHGLAMHSRRGRRGVGALRAVLEESYGREVPDSYFNRLALRLITSSGLPSPVVEHTVRRADGSFVARVDLAYPDLRIAIELDGRQHHLTARAFERDRARQNRLELEGWLVLRYTWRQYLSAPGGIVAEVASARRAREGR
jgi:hypothetical protein